MYVAQTFKMLFMWMVINARDLFIVFLIVICNFLFKSILLFDGTILLVHETQ